MRDDDDTTDYTAVNVIMEHMERVTFSFKHLIKDYEKQNIIYFVFHNLHNTYFYHRHYEFIF